MFQKLCICAVRRVRKIKNFVNGSEKVLELVTCIAISNLRAFSGYRYLCVPRVCSSGKAQENFEDVRRKRYLILTHQMVRSTMLNTHSDLVNLSFFFWCAKQPNYFHEPMAFDYMVGVIGRLLERFKTLKVLLGELESVGCIAKAQTFLLLIRIFWRGGMYWWAFEAFEQMSCYGFTPNTFAHNVIMDVLFKIGRPDIAIKVLEETPLPNFLTFSMALRNLSKLNDIVCTRDILRHMMGQGYYPNAGTFEGILNGFCKMGRLVEAYQVLGVMIVLGTPISVSIWSILIDCFCRLGEIDNAAYLLEKMVENGCSPSIVTYTTIIKGYIDSGLIDDAFCVLKIMDAEGQSPDLVLCNALINSLSKVGRYEDAIGVFNRMMKHHIEPDSYTFTSLLSTICLSEKFDLLPQIFYGQLIEVDLVFLNSLINCYCKAGYPSLAVELYNKILGNGFTPDNYSFAGLLSGLCGSSRIFEAVNVYKGIILNNTYLDAHIHTVIMSGLIKAGKYHSAIRLFNKIILRKYSVDAVSYTVAIRGLLMAGGTMQACNLYCQMKEVGIVPVPHTCNIMISGFCREWNSKLVKWMLQEMIDMRLELSYYNCCKLYKMLSKLDHSHHIFSMFVEMRNLDLIPAKAVGELWLGEPAIPIDLLAQSFWPSKGYVKSDLADTSGSEHFSDVATSVG